MRRLLLAVLLVALVMPASAGATSLAALRAALPVAQRIAEARWSPDACDGRTRIVPMTSAALIAIRGIDDADAQALIATCTIDIALVPEDSRTGLCATIVHERGHLHGVTYSGNPTDPAHSTNPRSIMFPSILVAPRDCMTAFPPYEVRRQRSRGGRCWPQLGSYAWRCARLLDPIPAI
jgi:hypothetical protein